jgi:hypothetical protein
VRVAQELNDAREEAAEQLIGEVARQCGDGSDRLLLHHGAGPLVLEDLECDLLQCVDLDVLQHGSKASRDFGQDVDGVAVGALLEVDLQHALGNPGQACLGGRDDMVADQTRDQHLADCAVRIHDGLPASKTADGVWQGDDDFAEGEGGYRLVDRVVRLQVGELLDHGTQDLVRDLVHEGAKALDCLVLHLAVGVDQRVHQPLHRLGACYVVVVEEAGVRDHENVVQVTEGHEAEVGIVIVELRQQLGDVVRGRVGRNRRGCHGGGECVRESSIPTSVSACLGTCGVAGLTMLTMVGSRGAALAGGREAERGESADI